MTTHQTDETLSVTARDLRDIILLAEDIDRSKHNLSLTHLDNALAQLGDRVENLRMLVRGWKTR